MSDLVQVKDMMLKKCEMFSQMADRIKRIPSHYGKLDFLGFMSSTDLEQKSYEMNDNSLSPTMGGQSMDKATEYA